MNKKWALGNVGSGLSRLHSAQEWRMAMLGRSGPFHLYIVRRLGLARVLAIEELGRKEGFACTGLRRLECVRIKTGGQERQEVKRMSSK